MKTFDFSIEQIFSELPDFASKGITELSLHDEAFSKNKSGILNLARLIKKHCPDLFLSLKIVPSIIDRELVSELSDIYVSLDMPLSGTEKNGKLLFDKKVYSSKANLLNDAGLVFGFDIDFAVQKNDTFKLFRDRLDFAVSLFPNHINFHQFDGAYDIPSPTGVFSSKDIDFAKGIAFACNVFYTEGRAVTWFNSILSVLKINASSFFADFEEFQQCNSCSFESGFDFEKALHSDIEKLQLLFLSQKFSEKQKDRYLVAVKDIVRLNGALSRVSCGGEDEILETSYNPDDLLSYCSTDIHGFVENVTMEECRIKVFNSRNGVDFKVL